ncbi:MAG: hypothetical protein F8N37_17290 [Telmatospirillum sp.]|nr:hypothetical protein [Telmatospirillum sp.]
MGRLLVCLTMIAALAGCEAWNGTTKALRPGIPAATTFVLVDAASLINTHKTIDDHLISLLTGMDCSTVRASKGDHYCLEPPEQKPVYIRTTYCYKSLAKVTCYDQPFDKDATQLYGVRIDRIPVGLE